MVKLHPSDPLPAPPVETVATVNAMAQPAAIIGPDHRIVHVNPAYEKCFGFSERDVCGLPCYEVFRKRTEPCPQAEIPCPLREALSTERPVFVTHPYNTAEDEEICLQVEGAPLRDDDGNVTRVVQIMEPKSS